VSKEPISEKVLTQSLQNISKDEMEEFNRKRIVKYRILYLCAFLFGVISITSYFFLNIIWVIVFAVIGIRILQLSKYNREKWKKTFHNLVYLKHQGEKAKKAEISNKGKKNHSGNKYEKHKHLKKK
jgi:hypothetical protein